MAKDAKKNDAVADVDADQAAEKSAGAEDTTSDAAAKAGKKMKKTRMSAAWPMTALAVGLIGIVVAVVLFFRPGLGFENQAYADRAETDAVATAAAENAKKLVAIDYETLDDYVAGLPDIMTQGLEDELMKSWDQLADTYKQAKTKVDVTISDVGVTYLEENRAEVLIAQNVSVTQDGQAAGSTDGTYLIRLEKVDGDWKLSSIPDLPS